jgi:hypothetical protein
MPKSSPITKSRRSGGPKSDEGKRASSRNALKTGVYSSMIVLPGEDESAFQELEEQFIRDFDPLDIAERAIVRELATITWKKLRLEKLEQSSFLRTMNEPLRTYDFSDYGIRFNDTTFAFFIEGIVIPKEEARALEGKLGIALQLRGQNFTSEQYRTIKSKSPEIYQEIIQIGLSCDCFAAEPSIDNLVLSYIELEHGGEQSLSRYALEEIIALAQNALWYFNKYDAIKEAVSMIKEKRLLEIMQIDKTRRIHDDLSRTFFRALTELRKHQEWRRRLLIIDIPFQDGGGSKKLKD